MGCNEADVLPASVNSKKIANPEVLKPEMVHKYFGGNVTPEKQTEGN